MRVRAWAFTGFYDDLPTFHRLRVLDPAVPVWKAPAAPDHIYRLYAGHV
jgi:hypothetical protein